ncbi:MAG: hypothetical protein ACR2OC_00355 [Solirubrobacterales bacterium]
MIAIAALAGLGGCGSSESDEQETPSPGPLRGPTSPEGDIDQSAASLRSGEGYSTLVETQVMTRGNSDTLIAGQVQLTPGSTEPRLRLRVDGKTETNAEVSPAAGGAGKTLIISCACKLPTGDHIVVIEGTARSGTAKVGARTIIAFPDVKLDDTGADPVNASVLNTDTVQITAEGASLAEATAGSDGGESTPVVVIAALRAPRSGVGAENVRTEVLIDGSPPDEVAKTTIPSGKLVAYYDGDGPAAGDSIELRGYTTAGETPVSVGSLIICPCGLAN